LFSELSECPLYFLIRGAKRLLRALGGTLTTFFSPKIHAHLLKGWPLRACVETIGLSLKRLFETLQHRLRLKFRYVLSTPHLTCRAGNPVHGLLKQKGRPKVPQVKEVRAPQTNARDFKHRVRGVPKNGKNPASLRLTGAKLCMQLPFGASDIQAE
jgi:hypothetical protein